MTLPAVLVTGASGFIGRPLVERLAASGYGVTALSRRGDATFPAGVRVVRVDLGTGAGVSSRLFDGIGVVFHCAGEVRRTELMNDLHVGGTHRLIEAASARDRSTLLHWVQLSSVGAYGPAASAGHPRQVDENTAEHPRGEYEITKTESDRLVRHAAGEGLLSLAILRPANVIGPRMPNASLPRIIRLVQRRLFFYVGGPGAVSNYVHVDDVVSALVACAADPAATRQVFNLSSDCTWEDLIERIAATAGVRAPRLRVPARLMRALGGGVGERLGNPLTSAKIDALVGRTRYPSTKIESMLHFRFAKPMPAGIDSLVTQLA